MKIAALSDIRSDPAAYLSTGEPLLVTRNGEATGVYIPLGGSEPQPSELEGVVARMLSSHLTQFLGAASSSPEEVSAEPERRRFEEAPKRQILTCSFDELVATSWEDSWNPDS